jgi:hypothetical protein
MADYNAQAGSRGSRPAAAAESIISEYEWRNIEGTLRSVGYAFLTEVSR